MSQTYYANLANDRLIVIEQYATALRKLVEAVGLLEGEEITYGTCKALNAAIAEAERLLK